MGGMGTIHQANDFVIYSQNHIMTINLLAASVGASVKKFLYASSACAYPESLQTIDTADVSLRETDVWTTGIPRPQGLYGLEKLVSELVLEQYKTVLDIRIARFHNVYGPRSSWNDGREKAPAAMCRKAIVAKLGTGPVPFEIWGDGSQRRSFLYIDDCVDAVCHLITSDCADVVNIGSSESVTIQELANLTLQSADVDTGTVQFRYDVDKPVGVGSRNSNNDFVYQQLGWAPKISLKEGIRRTSDWIEGQIRGVLENCNDATRGSVIQSFLTSEVLDLKSEAIIFAVLLPVTSRGLPDPGDCLKNVADFSRSLKRTTWRDTHQVGGQTYRLRIYIAIDHDDEYLLNDGNENKVERILREFDFTDIVSSVCDYPRGQVCSLWRHCARRAWEDGCDYSVLMGDDVMLEDEGWMRDAHTLFLTISEEQHTPIGFGIVAFTDLTFPGMPTFPIVGRTHMEAFGGEVVPSVFINQDGDPYLFQLYRRWGCARMFNSRIRNKQGGEGDARYTKQHVTNWTTGVLNSSTTFLEDWLRHNGHPVERNITLDVIIPSYRVQPQFLEPILQLRPSNTCTVMFIIIIDDPTSPHTFALKHKYDHRPDVRIRANVENLGASASRNRGMGESTAEWVHFLDDDVEPQPDLLLEAEKAIRAHPNAAGFVGYTRFPSADNVFTAAVHLSGVTYFWDIATKMDSDIPWGVTANLIARRDNDGSRYDLSFPKTGGGEDIDFCRKTRESSIKAGKEGFYAAPNVVVVHPWWSGAKRSYRRFFMWSVGDGRLVAMYPEHRYRDIAPNSAELLLCCSALVLIGCAYGIIRNKWWIALISFQAAVSVLLANILHDCYRHLWRDSARVAGMTTTVDGVGWFLAVVESSIVRMISEAGRTLGMVRRFELDQLGHRFDWFAGRFGEVPMEDERRNGFQRLSLAVLIFLISCPA